MSGPAIDRETLDRLLDITGGDVEFLDELVDTYLEDGRAQVAALQAAVAAMRSRTWCGRPTRSSPAAPTSGRCSSPRPAASSRPLREPVPWTMRADGSTAIAAAFDAARDGLLAARAERD